MHYKKILYLFFDATSMLVNINKSTIYFLVVEARIRHTLIDLFSFLSFELGDGLKYLGYMLKPNNYEISDSKCLLTNIEKKINC
jgi:hypothetical protein